MPIVATLYHNNDGTVAPFLALTPHEARDYCVEPISLGCNRNVMQARDGTLPGAVTTAGAEGSTNIASISIAGTGGIDLG